MVVADFVQCGRYLAVADATTADRVIRVYQLGDDDAVTDLGAVAVGLPVQSTNGLSCW